MRLINLGLLLSAGVLATGEACLDTLGITYRSDDIPRYYGKNNLHKKIDMKVGMPRYRWPFAGYKKRYTRADSWWDKSSGSERQEGNEGYKVKSTC